MSLQEPKRLFDADSGAPEELRLVLKAGRDALGPRPDHVRAVAERLAPLMGSSIAGAASGGSGASTAGALTKTAAPAAKAFLLKALVVVGVAGGAASAVHLAAHHVDAPAPSVAASLSRAPLASAFAPRARVASPPPEAPEANQSEPRPVGPSANDRAAAPGDAPRRDAPPREAARTERKPEKPERVETHDQGRPRSEGAAAAMTPAPSDAARPTAAVNPAPSDAARSAAPPAAPAPTGPTTEPAPSAPRPETELGLLSRARQLVRTDPGAALEILNEHAAHFPHSALEQEREVLAIEALVDLGRLTEARRRAAAFDVAFPGSAHRRRIRALLGRSGDDDF